MAISVCFCSTDMNALAQKNEEEYLVEQAEKDSEILELGGVLQEDEEDYFDNQLTKYEGGHFQVINCLTDRWEGGFNASFVVKNTGNMDIRNWYIKFPAQFDIANIWNAEIEREENGVYLVKNVGWNSVIESGGCVQFFVTAYENFTEFPNDYEIIGTNVKVPEDAYEIGYEVYDEWDTGYTGAITINNISTEVIEDWKLEFDFMNEFTDLWDAEILTHEGSHYVIQNAGYNSNIGVGERVSVGFKVGFGDVKEVLLNVSLSAFSLNDSVEGTIGILEEQDKSYAKDVAEEDIIFDNESGAPYVKNQIIVATHLGASEELMINLADELGADIVGYTDVIEQYILEFRNDMLYTELREKIVYVKELPFVRYATINYSMPSAAQYFTNDALYVTNELWETTWTDSNKDKKCQDTERKNKKTEGKNDGWNKYMVGGNNWGLEALKVHMAWEYSEYFQGPVKVGIYDNMYGQNEDLVYSAIYNNSGVLDSVHGTHVAGIIGAKHNNGKGISGVSTDAKLYAYTVKDTFDDNVSMITKMIKNGARIVNVSYGYTDDVSYSATMKPKGKAYKAIMEQADILGEALECLIDQGYDFLIVVAAGNGNGCTYVKDKKGTYEYSVFDSTVDRHVTLTKIIGYPDAKYSYHFNAIEKESVKSRIMVVGAVEYLGKEKYAVANFSQEGSRVDTYAPGVNILSTVPKSGFCDSYMVLSGTSQATPHISGLAALMLQVNPNLTAAQVKDIIKKNKGNKVGDKKYMPDAENCVLEAINAAD